MENYPQIPEESILDKFYELIKNVISIIPEPITNITITTLFSAFLTKPIEKRRDKFLQDLAFDIWLLSMKVEKFKPENLQNDPNFISGTLRATQIAMQSHQKEKIKALRNAALNSVLMKEIRDDIKHIYLSLVDELTPISMIVLKYFSNDLLKINFHPDFKEHHEHFIVENSNLNISDSEFSFITRDLDAKGLIDKDQGNYFKHSGGPTHVSTKLSHNARLSHSGILFLKFISEPKELEN